MQAALGSRLGARASDFKQGMAGERGVPHRRQARLAIGFVAVHHQQLLDGCTRHRHVGIGARYAQHIEHHHGIRHGREDGAQAILAVQPFAHELFRTGDGALAQATGEQRLRHAQPGVEHAEHAEPDAILMRCPRRQAGCLARTDKQFVDADAARIPCLGAQAVEHQQRHDHRAGPVGHLGQMEREPERQQHDLDRHHRHRLPRHHAIQREQRAGEDIAGLRPAHRVDGLAGTPHMLGIGVVADHLEGEIRLHAGADVGATLMEQRPAAVGVLDPAQIARDTRFQHVIRSFAQIMDQQYIFGRDRGIRLQLEYPVAIGPLGCQQGVQRAAERAFQLAVLRRTLFSRKRLRGQYNLAHRSRCPLFNNATTATTAIPQVRKPVRDRLRRSRAAAESTAGARAAPGPAPAGWPSRGPANAAGRRGRPRP